MAVEVIQMTMIKTPIEIDQEALETAAEVLGTKTKKDTVNAALKEVGQRLTRLRALATLGEMVWPGGGGRIFPRAARGGRADGGGQDSRSGPGLAARVVGRTRRPLLESARLHRPDSLESLPC
jgi:Arc/MetJ family transcription regulator